MRIRDAMRAAGVAAALAAANGPAAAQDGADASALRAQALEAVNAARAEAGLDALAADDALDRAARAHAEDMLARGYHAHVDPDGGTPRERFLAAGGDRWAVSGENIATCSGCPVPPGPERVADFQAGWMQSPGHRDNVLSPGFDAFGYAIVGADGEVYAAQTFSGPGGSPDDGDDAPTRTALRAAALEAANEARADAGAPSLTASRALDTLAVRALDAVRAEDALPGDPFTLLPEGAEGWTILELLASDVGGAGPAMTLEDASRIVAETVHDADRDGVASHLGFAARADGQGRKTGVVVLGGRGPRQLR